MEKEKKLIVFANKQIRRTWHNDEWYFSVVDVVLALTDSKDPKQYIKKLRQRDEMLSQGWVQFVPSLSIETKGGKQKINCANKQGIFRIIQSIPSKKAEPFKLWLAKVGSERIEEIENPELAQERMKQLYEQKGYSKEWIDKRLRGIAVRLELTNEWKNRDVDDSVEYAILTDEIAKATFGKTIKEYKEHKNLNKEPLRDHMTDLELIFNMLGEASTTKIAKNKHAKGFIENKIAAKLGGEVAGKAREDLEEKSGEKVVSKENYLIETERSKRLKNKKKIQIEK
jgi:prophage antirepressor-like protein